MTAEQFLKSLEKQPPAPVYLFVGPDAYQRDRCRRALTAAAVPADSIEEGVTRHDLDRLTIAEVLDDASSYSLFATQRLIWVSGAEAALPKRLVEGKDDEGPGALLKQWTRNPVPGVTLVFDCSRYDLEGEELLKAQRVMKYYGAIHDVVEFPRFNPEQARRLAGELGKARGVRLGSEEIEMLVEATGADAAKIDSEIEKLALHGTAVTPALLADLVPNARSANIFDLANALGRRDRMRSLDILATLVREGEYLPLALSSLGGQLRTALTCQEANLRDANAIQNQFRLSRGRAEGIARTVAEFPAGRLRKAIDLVARADIALRDTRPDDQTVMEALVWAITA